MFERLRQMAKQLVNRHLNQHESDLFPISHQVIEEQSAPPDFNGIVASQNGYAVSVKQAKGAAQKKGMPEEAHLLGTISVCHLIHLARPAAGVNVLAHLDPGMDNIVSLYRAMSHLIKARIIESPKSAKSSILTATTSNIKAVERSFLALHVLGFRPNVINCISLSPLGISGVDSEGRLTRLKNSNEMGPKLLKYNEHWKKRHIARSKRTLLYNNEGRFLREEAFQIYPEVPAFVCNEPNFWEELNSRMQKKLQNPFKLWSQVKGAMAHRTAEYSFNIPLEKGFELDEAKIEGEDGVEVKSMKCKHGEYLHVGATKKGGQLDAQAIRKVQNVYFSVARQIAEHHEKQAA